MQILAIYLGHYHITCNWEGSVSPQTEMQYLFLPAYSSHNTKYLHINMS